MSQMPTNKGPLPWLFGSNPMGGGSGYEFMGNPLLNIGLGILAANRPGASFGQAVGGGALAGIGAMQRAQRLKTESELSKLRAESLRGEIDRAKEAAELDAKMRAIISDPYKSLAEKQAAVESLQGPSEWMARRDRAQDRADTKEHRARQYGLDERRLALSEQEMRQRQASAQAEAAMKDPYYRAMTQKYLADAAMTIDKTENPDKYKTQTGGKPKSMPSPTKGDIGRAMTAITSDPDLKLLDEDGQKRAADTIASAARAMQAQGVRGDVAMQMAVTELKASGGFTFGQEKAWWQFDDPAKYNPYAPVPAPAASAAPEPTGNVVNWADLPR